MKISGSIVLLPGDSTSLLLNKEKPNPGQQLEERTAMVQRILNNEEGRKISNSAIRGGVAYNVCSMCVFIWIYADQLDVIRRISKLMAVCAN